MSDVQLIGGGFDIGEVLRGTFGIIRRHFWPVILLCLAAYTVDKLIAVFLVAGLVGISPSVWVAGSTLPASIIGLFSNAFLTGALTTLVVEDLNGNAPRAGTLFRTGFRLLLPIAALNFVLYLGIILGTVLLIVPGIMLYMRWFVAASARAAEGRGLRRALTRSAELTSGNRWKLFGLCIVIAICASVFYGIRTLALVGAAFGTDMTALGAVSIIINILMSTIIGGVTTVAVAVTYTELRRVAEGGLSGQVAAVFD